MILLRDFRKMHVNDASKFHNLSVVMQLRPDQILDEIRNVCSMI